MQYGQWLQQAEQKLVAANWLAETHPPATLAQLAKRDAQILLSFVTGLSRSYLFAFAERLLNEQQLQSLKQLLTLRCDGQPMAYLLGEKEFWSLPLQVSPLTLIPRPATELLVELALQYLPATEQRVVDLGTGTGAIALALAKERADWQITAVDYLPEIVQLAQQNANRLALTQVIFRQSDWFSALAGETFNLIISNPPYIDETDPHLQQGDVRFEPHSALVAAQQGLACLQTIIAQSVNYLRNNGYLLVEHGWQQAGNVVNLFKQAGFVNVITQHDYAGQPRVTLGQWRTSSTDRGFRP